ncbi:hypothetical protein [Mucilaginibacter sp.]|uniref:hypothetical protein n=1 Tax=Mucilaginibacter sp. TaxID=1882438 RepID=UPI00326511B4
MKLAIKLTLLLLLPVALYAQDTTAVKKQANIVAAALIAGNYSTVINYMHPKVLKMVGGKDKLLQLMTNGMKQMKAQGITFQSATIGSPGKFYKAGTEIHCLVPENVTMKVGANTLHSQSNLLAVSSDKGKNWTFIDLNKNTIAQIPKMFPNFNKDLKIPEPKQMGM